MAIIKKCVTIINNRSGHRHKARAYTDTLKQYMDRAGIVHHDIHVPNDDVGENFCRALPHAEALVICGGDGTVNRAVNLMACMATTATKPTSSGEHCESSALLSSSLPQIQSVLDATPLLLVPTGLHNSIATSLGIGAAERAVSSLVVGRAVHIPLWAVRLHSPSAPPTSPAPVRYMCSYIAAGTYAAIVQRQETFKAAQGDYVSLPPLLGTLAAASLYTTVQHSTPHCTAELKTSTGSSSDLALHSLGPLRMLVAAQMPQLQAGYSLTPTATYHQHRLAVTTAADDVTRMRMWHLLRREAREGYILSEDGVAMHEEVRELRVEFPRPSGEGTGSQKSDCNLDVGDSKTAADDEETALLVLDGECVRIPHGSSVTVTPTELTAQLIVS
ncbi:hypothetical protein ABL78_8031 [Leptomonas seymouri]|uniref:DAGKc domain-containing protein n=1 Tax=Leptomonas seymouri TaxID=5684 RepID=A0A0N1IHE5_LEPSE|nr:hypothetical protein ABL78_8031 [Leptomonas seymouri]|eukprot:KPI82955.1 hypothetical protein ABL78_8031 [Leptomonas seymouri]